MCLGILMGMHPFKDLYILEISSHTWVCPNVRGGPDAREGHSAALGCKRLFIFGGCGNSVEDNVEVHYNYLYMLNTGDLEAELGRDSKTETQSNPETILQEILKHFRELDLRVKKDIKWEQSA